jgi:signal transduction histidine kinase
MQSPKMREIDLHQILSEVIDFSAQLMEQGGIRVSAKFAGMHANISGDAEMLKQVFLNVILNAQQAMPEGGTLMIGSNTTANQIRQRDAQSVEIVFQDSGPGIPVHNLSKIFDPFFSTKESGSGLGLAIVHNIIHQHNGSVNIENSIQGGVAVNISFPLPQKDEKGRGAKINV